MAQRVQDMEVRLLLVAIQKTTNWETLLGRRFTGATLEGARGPRLPPAQPQGAEVGTSCVFTRKGTGSIETQEAKACGELVRKHCNLNPETRTNNITDESHSLFCFSVSRCLTYCVD